MARFIRPRVYPVVPLTYFGMHTLALSPYSDWPSTYTIGALGKGTEEGWGYLEPTTKGVFVWTAADNWAAAAAAHSVDKFYHIGGPPSWAGGTPAGALNNSDDLPDFIDAFCARFIGPGLPTTIIDIVNEPHSLGWTAANLAAFCNIGVPALRAAAPNALLLTPTFYGLVSLFADYLTAGGTTDFDIVSIHTYPGFSQQNWPETVLRNYFGPHTVANPVQQASITSRWDATIAAWGMKGKPIWQTEGSWGFVGGGAAIISDQDQQAAWCSRSLLLHWSEGYVRNYWYAHRSVGQDWGELAGRVAETAYKETQEWMLGAKLMGRIRAGGVNQNYPGSVYEGYWTRTDPSGYEAYCAWDFGPTIIYIGADAKAANSGYDGSSSYTVPAGMNFYRDLAGTSTATTPGALVTIGSKPLWFESHDTS